MVNIVPKVFPDEPSSWNEITKLYSSTEWMAPEDGWFKFIVAGRGGTGGASYCSNWGKSTGLKLGSGGGAPGCSISEIALNKGDSVQINMNGSKTLCIVKGLTMTATNGNNGGYALSNSDYNGGTGGTASGGNKSNHNGPTGGSTGPQVQTDNYGSKVLGRSGGQLSVDGYDFYGGTGGGGTQKLYTDSNSRFYLWDKEVAPTGGSAAICIILRGNTNIPLDMQNAHNITSNALAIAALAQEQTGILLNTLVQL